MTCKTCGSCGAAIEWAITTGGKKVPLDPKPITIAVTMDDGNVRIVTGRQSHFASCPHAAKHRKPRQRGTVPCIMCEKPCTPGQAGTAIVGGAALCSRICVQAHRAKEALERRAKS